MTDTPDPDLGDDEMLIGRVIAYRIIDSDGDQRDEVHTDDGHGDTLDWATAVGMLAIAEHRLVCDHDD